MIGMDQLRLDLGQAGFADAGIGELYEIIAEQLMGPVFRNFRYWKLLGIMSAQSGKTLGDVDVRYLPSPGLRHLVVSIAPDRTESQFSSSETAVFRRKSAVLRHGSALNRLSIGLSSTQLNSMKLKTNIRWLAFLRRAISAMSIGKQHATWSPDYEARQLRRTMKQNHDMYWDTTFESMFKLPYAYWPFCRECWQTPNLISSRLLTDYVALYYFCYVWTMYDAGGAINIRSTYSPVRARLVAALRDSLLRLRHTVHSKQPLGNDPISLIAPLVLYYRETGIASMDWDVLNNYISASFVSTSSRGGVPADVLRVIAATVAALRETDRRPDAMLRNWTSYGPRTCHGVVARAIVKRGEKSDRVLILGELPDMPTHSVLVSRDNHVVADSFNGHLDLTHGTYTFTHSDVTHTISVLTTMLVSDLLFMIGE